MAIMLLFVFYKIVSRLPTDVVARLSTTPESEILLSIKKGVCLTTFCCFMTPPRQKLTCYCLTSAHLWLPYFQTKIFFSLIWELRSSALISLKSYLTWALELILGKHFLFTFAFERRRSVSLKKCEAFFLVSRIM